mmetsp:Transcript_42253/g.49377  ORF Transcript_42253/g.49377 Transcript_42253/m.49377 type:complete len:94 (+) Transcript_42253:369-650(+)
MPMFRDKRPLFRNKGGEEEGEKTLCLCRNVETTTGSVGSSQFLLSLSKRVPTWDGFFKKNVAHVFQWYYFVFDNVSDTLVNSETESRNVYVSF